MNKEKNVKNIILFVQIILTIFGTGLAFILFFRTITKIRIFILKV